MGRQGYSSRKLSRHMVQKVNNQPKYPIKREQPIEMEKYQTTGSEATRPQLQTCIQMTTLRRVFFKKIVAAHGATGAESTKVSN